MTTVIVICIYLALLLGLALFSKTLFRGTSKDYFVASHSIGPFMLLMSVFGTTMTAFALVGSTGKAFGAGIGTYGLMASSSGLIHAACFFMIGIKLWAIGKRYGYVTQIQYFRARFESSAFGYLLFPILVLLVIPYLLIGVIGAAKTIEGVTKAKGPMPGVFPEWTANGGVPPWLTGLIICIVVLTYIFAGGSRATAWANTFQTIVFMIMGVLAFYLISEKLGGVAQAIEQAKDSHKVRTVDGKVGISQLTFLTYMFIPLSVGMFPHLFQHWLTAKSAKSFKLTVIAHPLCIAIVWVPCVLIGIWATGQIPEGTNPAIVLSMMVGKLVSDPLIVGLVTAGILAAIMSSLDSQFLCLGTMFTNDIVLHNSKKTYTDKQTIFMARAFIVAIVLIIYLISLVLLQQEKQHIFSLAIWSFSGFAALTPLVIAALYWKRATKTGAYACVISVFVSWVIFFSMSGFGGELHILGGVTPAAIMWFIGATAMIVGSLVSAPPKEEVIAKYF
ncbi:sodium:solute symporter family protein [Akkermansiaceae bacterium]|nr:sodium:solute symporter family protein [Akkermansiaceae bacterium]MDB4278992.1 sodium:solute symporter family protein [bacterium]MDB4271806.1 sodium:solute symporter family protein [Akkermansiaceae bacterium]MDB4332648.1 sodium:solute symporter family protein [Akkermansiaceae bacterium]MDB4626926.1 sodium:solute symporter family protein [Akkermansiaceae bacterium]